MRQARLEGLDLLRGVAALAVVLLHISIAFPHIATPFTKAYLAVDFFFMLSGYVLTRTYQHRFAEGLGTSRFLVLRLRRLWPTIAIGVIVGMASQLGDRPLADQLVLLGMGLALIPLLAGGPIFPLNGVIWSILFELVGNWVHVVGLSKLSRPALLGVAMAMALLMLGGAAAFGTFDLGSWGPNFWFGFPRVLLSYSIGCWLFLTLRDRALMSWSAESAAVVLPTLFLTGWVMEGGWRFDLAFVLLACPLILVVGLGATTSGSALARLAGDLSFPLYAVHMPILFMVAAAGLPWFAAPPAAIAAAWVTLRLTERAGGVWLLLRRGLSRAALRA